MTTNTAAKIKELRSIIEANYAATGNPNPGFAADSILPLILKVALGQPKYTDQLLDEEIEDQLKASARIAA